MKFAEVSALNDTALVYIAEGVPTGTGTLDALAKRYERPGFDRVRGYIWDALGAGEAVSDETRRDSLRANDMRKRWNDQRPQFVVFDVNDPLRYGMARMRQQWQDFPVVLTGSLIDAFEQLNRLPLTGTTAPPEPLDIAVNENATARILVLPIVGGAALWYIFEGRLDARFMSATIDRRYEQPGLGRVKAYISDYRFTGETDPIEVARLAHDSSVRRVTRNDQRPTYIVVRPGDLDQYGSARRGEQLSEYPLHIVDSLVDCLSSVRQSLAKDSGRE